MKGNKHFISMAGRIQLAIAVLLLVTFSTIAIILHSTIKRTELVITSNLVTSLANQYAAEIDKQIEENLNVIRSTARMFSSITDMKPEDQKNLLMAFSKTIVSQSISIDTLYVIINAEYWSGFDRDEAWAYFDKAGNIIDETVAQTTVESFSWYVPIKNQNQETVSDMHSSYNNEKLVITLAVPIQNQKAQQIGILAVDIDVFALNTIIIKARPMGKGYAVLFTKTGTILAHGDSNKTIYQAQNALTETTLKPGDILVEQRTIEYESERWETGWHELNEQLSIGQPYTGRLQSALNNSLWKAGIAPFRIGDSYTIWAIGIFLPEALITKDFNNFITVLLSIAAASFFMSMLIIIAMSKSFLRPLTLFSKAFISISEGDADLTRTIHITGKSEITQLADSFNDFLVKLQTLVTQIKETAHTGYSIGSNIYEHSSNTSEVLTKAQSDLNTTKRKLDELKNLLERFTDTINNISKNSESLNNKLAKQSHDSETAMDTIDSTIKNMAQLAKVALDKKKVSDSLNTNASEAIKIVEQLITSVREIALDAEKIKSFNELINDIAERTNLLAMNAAIEAAHAGDKGKGFAVVADEIRKLAEEAGKNAALIQTEISGILARIENAITDSAQATTSMHALAKGTAEMADAMNSMIGSVRQSAQQTGSISAVFETLKIATQESIHVVSEIAQNSERLLSENENNQTLIMEMITVLNDFIQTSQIIITSIVAIEQLGKDNMDALTNLEQEVSKFKI